MSAAANEAANGPAEGPGGVAASPPRIPRAPFAGTPVRDLVRDGVAAAALLVALALPWVAEVSAEPPYFVPALLAVSGGAHLEVVLATLVALAAVVLPYAHRAGVVTAPWAGEESRVRLTGVLPLVVVALVHLVLDVVPGGSWGVGPGLGLSLAAALLAAGGTAAVAWPGTRWAVAGIAALFAVLAPVLAATGEGTLSVWGVLAAVATALLALGFLWLTVWRHERGDQAAGVLLVAVGIVVALGMAFLAPNLRAPWTESARYWWVGLVLWPALAAVAAPRVVAQTLGAGDQPRLWSRTAAHALLLATGLGAYVALVATFALVDGDRGTPVILRLVFGVIVAVVAFLGRRALVKDLAAGHAPAVGAAVVVGVLGFVLLVVRANALGGVEPLDYLLTFGVPAVVLSVLLVPRSLRSLRAELAAAAALEPVDDGGAAGGGAGAGGAGAGDAGAGAASSSGPRGVRTAGHRARNAAGGAAGAAAGAVVGAAAPGTGGRTTTPPTVGGEPTTILTPVQAARPVEADRGEAVDAGEPGAPTADGSPQEVADSHAVEEPAAASQAPADGVGATQVLPAIADQPGSRWTAAHAVDPATPLADLALIVQEAPHLRPLVASNPSTYPALLDWLGALGDPEIDAALRARR